MLRTFSCILAILALGSLVSAENYYFYPQTNLVGEVDRDWFNGNNWFVYDELGSLWPAGTPPRDGEVAIVSDLADVGENLVRLGGLVLTNAAGISNGTFAVSDMLIMAPESRFDNTKINLLGSFLAEGAGCTLDGGVFHLLSGAVGVLEPGHGASIAELILENGAVVRIDGRLTLKENSALRGGRAPTSRIEVRVIGTLASDGTNFVKADPSAPLTIDHSGLVESGGGRFEFQTGIAWTSTVGANQFHTASSSALIDFTGPFRVPPNVTSIFFGPGTNRILAATQVEGTLRVGANPAGSLEVHAALSGQGLVQILSADIASVLNWHDGVVGCRAVDIGPGSLLAIHRSGTGARSLFACTLTNSGVCVLNAPELSLSAGSVITNSGTFELAAPGVLLSPNGPADGLFYNGGTLRKTGGGLASFGRSTSGQDSSLPLNSSGLVEVTAGTLNVAHGVSAGEFRTAASGSLVFWNGLHSLLPDIRFTGPGEVYVSDPTQHPILQTMGAASFENLTVAEHGTLGGPGYIGSAVVTVNELLLRSSATITNTSLVANTARFNDCQLRDAAVEIAHALEISGASNVVDGSFLTLHPAVVATTATNSAVYFEGGELHCLGTLTSSRGTRLGTTGTVPGRLQLYRGGVLVSAGNTLVTASHPGGLVFDNSGLVQVQQGRFEIAPTVTLQSSPGPATFETQPTAELAFAAPFSLPNGANMVLIGPGTNVVAEPWNISGNLHLGGHHPLSGRFIAGHLQLSADLSGPGALFIHGTNSLGSLLDWNAGTVSARVSISPGALALIRSPAAKLSGGKIQNSGLMQLRSAELQFSGNAVLENQSSGTIEVVDTSALVGGPPPAGGVVTNAGVLRKSGPGSLQFGTASDAAPLVYNTGLIDLAQGEISIGPGLSTGEFRAAVNSPISFWSGSHVLNAGARFTGPGAVRISGTLSPAALVFQAQVSIPALELGDNGTLTGPGRATVTQNMTWTGGKLDGTGDLDIAPSAQLTIGGPSPKFWAKRTLSNFGQIRWNSGGDLAVVDGAQLSNQAGASCELLGANRVISSEGSLPLMLANSGTLVKSGDGTVSDLALNLENSGRTEVNSGTLKVAGAWTQYAGETSVAASGLAAGSRIRILGGIISGMGQVNADLENAAIVSPGIGGVGALSLIDGQGFEQLPGGTLVLEIAGTSSGQFDHLSVSGDAQLQGAVQVRLLNGFTPALGDSFTFLNAQTLTGSFAGFNGLTPPDTAWSALYTSNSVTLVLSRALYLESPSISNGALQFAFQTVLGSSYTVQATDALKPVVWRTLRTLMGHGSRVSFSDPIGERSRFYRVIVE